MKKKLRKIFPILITIELASLLGYYISDFRQVMFFVIAGIALFVSIKDLRFGLLILIAELILGSKGYLFYFELNGMILSIRIALWLIVMSVWFSKLCLEISQKIKQKIKINLIDLNGFRFFKSSNWPYYLLLFVFMLIGVISGAARGNALSNIFFDFNAWLFFFLVLPVFSAFKSKKDFTSILHVFVIAASWISIKTLLLLYIFSHNIQLINYEVYRWVRTSGVGEVTQMQGGFYRIFFQSHIYLLFAFIIFGSLLFYRLYRKDETFKNKQVQLLSLGLILSGAVILISNSRSNWVGLFIGMALLFAYLILIYGFKKFLKAVVIFLFLGILGFGLVVINAKFPFPNPTGGFSASELITNRATQVSGEAAVSSRWALLPVLWREIRKAPVFGLGFGATVTYKSSDPRVLETSPDGTYTTYAFEWGWFDTWLKIGFLGTMSYLVLLFMIVINPLKNIFKQRLNQTKVDILNVSLVICIIILSTTSIFSPYMNHPLGIGAIVIISLILDNKLGILSEKSTE